MPWLDGTAITLIFRQYTLDKRALAFRVQLPIEPMPDRERSLEGRVLCSKPSAFPQRVPESYPIVPETTTEWHQMQVMRSVSR
jgi:hypothetical protein